MTVCNMKSVHLNDTDAHVDPAIENTAHTGVQQARNGTKTCLPDTDCWYYIKGIPT